MTLRLLLVACLLPATASAADRVSKAVRTEFRDLVARAAKASPDEAIDLYVAALDGPLKGYGRVHLQLGELYQDRKRWAEAAFHFRACDRDDRVESIDRELVCQGGFKSATAPLEGLPAGAAARVIEPRGFAGPVRNGDRLPRGAVRLEVTAAGKARVATMQVTEVARWVPTVEVPSGFVAPDDPGKPIPSGFVEPDTPGFVAAAKTPVAPADEAIRWPAYAAAGLGAALLGTGLVIGLGGQSELEELRDRQENMMWRRGDALDLTRLESDATTADVLVYTGAGLMVSAVALWFIFDGPAGSEAPADDAFRPDEDADSDSDERSDETLDTLEESE